MMRLFIVFFVIVVSLATRVSAAAPEPPGLWNGSMHGETPGSLKGGTVIQTEDVAQLKESVHPIFLDVDEAVKNPVENSKDTSLNLAHLSIQGAVWFPGAGSGNPDPAFERAFKAHISALTATNLDQPIVVFCHPRRWDGWNAAKRLIGLGYRKVYWYPQGVDGWQTLYPTEMVKADAGWLSSLPDALDMTQAQPRWQ